MEKLLYMVEQVVSSSTQEDKIDEQLFQQFMLKNPIWDFHFLTREQQLALLNEKKVELMKSYYNSLKSLVSYLSVVSTF